MTAYFSICLKPIVQKLKIDTIAARLNVIKSMVNDNLEGFTHDVDGDDIISGFNCLNQALNYGFIS